MLTREDRFVLMVGANARQSALATPADLIAIASDVDPTCLPASNEVMALRAAELCNFIENYGLRDNAGRIAPPWFRFKEK